MARGAREGLGQTWVRLGMDRNCACAYVTWGEEAGRRRV
jgi:hypothetical protein